MIEEQRPRIWPFLLIVIAIAGVLYILTTYVFNEDSGEKPPTKARVSNNDIRRAVAVPYNSIKHALEEQLSFTALFAELRANVLWIEVPLYLRDGFPVYLEYDKGGISALSTVIDEAHSVGLEVVLSPVITGEMTMLFEAAAAREAYRHYEEWLLAAAHSESDGLVMHPGLFGDAVAASAVLETITSLYEGFSGQLYMAVRPNDSTIINLYRKHVRGFVVSTNIEGLEGTCTILARTENVQFILDMHQPSVTVDVFEPFTTGPETHINRPDLSPLPGPLYSGSMENWFHGIVLPAPDFDEAGSYGDDMAVLYKWMKSQSMKRALTRSDGPGMIQ